MDNNSNADNNCIVISVVEVINSNNIDSTEHENHLCFSHCVVCGQHASGAHQCYSYLKLVHTICGLSDGTKGYGLKVLYILCKNNYHKFKRRSIRCKKCSIKHGL